MSNRCDSPSRTLPVEEHRAAEIDPDVAAGPDDGWLRNATNATVILDRALHLRGLSPAARDLLELAPSDQGGGMWCPHPGSPLSHDEIVEGAKRVLRDCIPVARRIERGGRWFSVAILPYWTAEAEVDGVIITVSDITDLSRTSTRLARREAQQAAIARLGLLAVEGAELDRLCRESAQLVAETLGTEFAKVLQLQPDTGTLRMIAGVGWEPGSVGRAEVSASLDSQAGYTLHSNEPIIVTDLATEARFSGPRLLLDHGVVSGLSCVVHMSGRPFGVLGAHSARPLLFTREDANFLQSVANILGGAIERSRTLSRLERQTLHARLMHEATLSAAQNESFDNALKECLETICHLTGWEVGHAWIINDKAISESGLWFMRDEAFAVFRDATDARTFRRGDGSFPDSIRDSGRPAVIENIHADADFPRSVHAGCAGLRGAFGFPIMVGESIVAILEFFTTRRGYLDDELLGTIRALGEQVGRVFERKVAERELRVSREQVRQNLEELRVIYDTAPIGMCVVDAELRYVRANRALANMDGRSVSEHIGRGVREVIPTLADRVEPWYQHVLETGESINDAEVIGCTPADPDDEHTWLLSFYPLRDASGSVVGVNTTVFDVTQQRAAEAHQRLLVRELSHRVKNVLAMVSSIASQTARGVESVENFREAFEGRLAALGHAHGLLLRSEWHGAPIRELVEEIIAPHVSPPGERIDIGGPDLVLEARAATTLSLVLHELTTNAVKYGSLSGPQGRIAIGWYEEMIAGQPWLVIEWTEQGGPAVSKPQHTGFGTLVIRQGIEFELDGGVDMRHEPQGFRCRLQVPWRHIRTSSLSSTPTRSGQEVAA